VEGKAWNEIKAASGIDTPRTAGVMSFAMCLAACKELAGHCVLSVNSSYEVGKDVLEWKIWAPSIGRHVSGESPDVLIARLATEIRIGKIGQTKAEEVWL
jgi:hypothetical protein